MTHSYTEPPRRHALPLYLVFLMFPGVQKIGEESRRWQCEEGAAGGQGVPPTPSDAASLQFRGPVAGRLLFAGQQTARACIAISPLLRKGAEPIAACRAPSRFSCSRFPFGWLIRWRALKKEQRARVGKCWSERYHLTQCVMPLNVMR